MWNEFALGHQLPFQLKRIPLPESSRPPLYERLWCTPRSARHLWKTKQRSYTAENTRKTKQKTIKNQNKDFEETWSRATGHGAAGGICLFCVDLQKKLNKFPTVSFFREMPMYRMYIVRVICKWLEGSSKPSQAWTKVSFRFNMSDHMPFWPRA